MNKQLIVLCLINCLCLQEPRSGVRAALADIHGVHLMYVAEIVPPAETAVVAFEGSFVPDTESEVSSGQPQPISGRHLVT